MQGKNFLIPNYALEKKYCFLWANALGLNKKAFLRSARKALQNFGNNNLTRPGGRMTLTRMIIVRVNSIF